MGFSVLDVAAAVIHRHRPIDPLKLQKIVFFASGKYMAITGDRMFSEPWEAWDYGPVVHSLYDAYRAFDASALISEPVAGDDTLLDDLAVGCIEDALEQFGEQTGARLIDIGHMERAWSETYVPGVRRKPIPDPLMVESFREKANPSALDESLLSALFAV